MKKKRITTLKAHLWIYFCTFAVCIMAILWILQILFLGAFFNTMKLNEMKKIGTMIKQQYDVNNEDFYKFWFEHSFRSGMFAHLVTESGETVRNYDNPAEANPDREHRIDRGEPSPRWNGWGTDNTENIIKYIDKVKSSGNSVAFTEDGYPHMRGARFAIYGSLLGEKNGENIYLFLMSPLERTDVTRRVLQTQLIIVSGISILLALVLAYFIAKRLSKPIEETTLSAGKLASGDYNVRFSGGTYREIDELAEVLNATASELSCTEELRRDLISNVSHDLRTPLTIIRSYAELIRDISGPNEEKRKKHTEIIVNEANNLSMLVNDMLDLSRIQSGAVAMNMECFDISSLVSRTLERFDYYRENFSIDFRLSLCSEKAYVSGDEKRIEQAVYNLIANAVNYTGDDKKVMVTLEEKEESYRLNVIDTGCGIKEEDIPKVWEKYYRASENRHRESIGTGIGLSIVKNILVSHNSVFGVNSKEGGGSCFYFELKKC